VVQVIPSSAGPLHPIGRRFIPPWTGSPPAFLTTSRPPGHVAGAASLGSRTLQRHPRASPTWTEPFQARSGSALRFSQPLSGFLAGTSSTGLFHPAAIPGLPPFRVFPSRRSWSPLEATSSPAVIHRRARARRSLPFTSGFPDAHAVTRGCLVPPLTMGSLSPGSRLAPGHPGPRTTGSLATASFTHLEAFLPP
jgi:hypothetical protein